MFHNYYLRTVFNKFKFILQGPEGIPGTAIPIWPKLADLAFGLGLALANVGSTPTFVRGTATAIIDVTFYCGVGLTEWQILNVDFCVLVTLDIKNAFNSLRKPVIDDALRRKNTPEYLVEMMRSWLTDRKLLTGEQLVLRRVTCGVPQGLVLGPALWNVAYDSLLEDPNGVHLIGFTDDLAMVGVARTGQLLDDAVNPVLQDIDTWMRNRSQEHTHHKTEAGYSPGDKPLTDCSLETRSSAISELEVSWGYP